MFTDIKRTQHELYVKADFLGYLPQPRTEYASEVDFAKHEMYDFDKDRYEQDDDYHAYVTDRFINYSDDCVVFNDLLSRAVNAVLK